MVQAKLTACVSEQKAITGEFPWEALGFLFMDVRECAEEKIVGNVQSKAVAFLDQPFPS